MLWLALHLPRLPIEVFLRARDPAAGGSAAAPFAVGEAGSPPRLLIVTPEAERLGLALVEFARLKPHGVNETDLRHRR